MQTDVTSGTALLAAIDAGRLEEVLAPDTPELWLACAEVAAYHGNVSEALADIDRAGDLSPSLRLRAQCIRAELCIGTGDTATAESVAYDVLSESLATGDRQACVRARIAVVRVKVRDGRYRSALEDLPRLRREIDSDRSATDEQRQFRRAICDHLEAYCRLKLGDPNAALAGAHRAIAEFVRIGAGRWEGFARGVVGLALLDRGDYEGAIREFERSETCAAALSLPSQMLFARNNTALALMATGRVGDAANALRSSLDFRTGTVADVQCRLLLALALGTLGRASEARTVARKAVELADEIGHEETGGDARVLTAWLDGAADRVEQLRRRAEDRGRPFQVRLCLVCLADLQPSSQPDHADALLELVDELTARADELSPLVDRIRARLAVTPIRISGAVVTVDMTRGLPSLPDAVAAVERSVMARALEIAEGNQTKAAALVGVSRSVFQYRWRTVNGLPPRPVK